MITHVTALQPCMGMVEWIKGLDLQYQLNSTFRLVCTAGYPGNILGALAPIYNTLNLSHAYYALTFSVVLSPSLNTTSAL